MNKIKAGIIGGAGYTGGELIRLLIHHPQVDITFIHSRSNAGKPIASVHQDLVGETDLVFSDGINDDVDVLFLCVGHGEAKSFIDQNTIAPNIKIIDLSQDFRLKEDGQAPTINNQPVVYGLPEANKEEIKVAQHIANPGCFATAIQLGLLPLAKEGLLNEINTTGITGSTGAGQGLSPTSHFSWRANNIQAYKSLSHQHLAEINQTLQRRQKSSFAIYFVPWRGDFPRGIFISSVLSCDWEIDELNSLYTNFYKDHPFTMINKKEIFLKQVVNTNKCVIYLEKAGTKLVVHSAIDNLLKGASGQAVQNMNLMFGFEEKAGLGLKALMF